MVNKLATRPQLDELGKREVPAVLGGALAGHGTWSYDQASDVLTVSGNGKSSDIGVFVGKDGEFNKTGAIRILAGVNGTRTAFGEQVSIDTKVFATGRTVIKIDGGAGSDNLRFGVGQEFVNGGNPKVARVELNGGTGDDLIEYWRPARTPIQIVADGGAGNDKLDFGGTMFTTVPQSQLQPGSPLVGTITLSGGTGNDQISSDQRAAVVNGGSGADRFIANYGKAVTLSEFKALATNDYNDGEDAFSGSGRKEDGFK